MIIARLNIYKDLLRVRYSMYPPAAALTGSLIGMHFIEHYDYIKVFLSALVILLLWWGGMISNQIIDLKVDRKALILAQDGECDISATRERFPIATGTINVKNAVVFTLLIYFLAFLSAYFLGILCLLLAITIFFLTQLYNKYFKFKSLLGSLFFALLISSSFLMGGLGVNQITKLHLVIIELRHIVKKLGNEWRLFGYISFDVVKYYYNYTNTSNLPLIEFIQPEVQIFFYSDHCQIVSDNSECYTNYLVIAVRELQKSVDIIECDFSDVKDKEKFIEKVYLSQNLIMQDIAKKIIISRTKHYELQLRPLDLYSRPVFFTKADLTMFKIIYAKNARIAGISSEDKFISLFPYAPHLAFWITYFATEEMGLTGVHTGSVLGTKRQIELAERFECNWLAGTTTYIHYFLSKSIEQGAKFKQLHGIITGGERLSDGLRQKIEGMVEQLGGKGYKCVRDGYGVVESKLVAMECSPYSGYHVNPEVIFWECVDPKTGKNIGWDKGGDLAFTHIDGHGTILLRYLIGDQAEGGISYKKCSHCGVIIPRIIGPLGRSDEYCSSLNITKIKGTTINLNSLLDFLTSTDHLQEFRVVIMKQNENDPFSLDKLLIEIASKERDHNKLIKQIRDEVKSLTEITPEVIVKDKDDISADLIEGSLKGNKIVDLRKKQK